MYKNLAKKLALSAIIAISSLQASSVRAAEDQSVLEKVKMKAFLCLYWECPAMFVNATGLGSLIEMYGQRKAVQALTIARGDARNFADRVTMTEPGEMSNDLYRRMVVKLEPGDVVSISGRINDSTGHHFGEVPLNTEGLQVLDFKQGEGSTLKINGRPLVSKDLRAAHAATQNLIYDGVVKSPKNEFSSATNALLLNKMLLDFVGEK